MKEYHVNGLTCSNCTLKLEEQIQKLQDGGTAKLLHNSGKLVIDPKVPLVQVQHILRQEGASIAEQEGHQHDHPHETSTSMVRLLIVSALLYGVALLLDGRIDALPVIGIYLVATALSGYRTFIKGLKNLGRLSFTMDTLMTVALIGAIAIGEWKEATLVAILFGLNEWLESKGMDKVRHSMQQLMKSAPKQALLIEDGLERLVAVSSLLPNHQVRVKPGDQIPSDGTVIAGISSVNEAAITGESMPVRKAVNDEVFGGSVNQEGELFIRITKPYNDSSLAKILHLVEQAQETKTPTELFINRFAKYYTPLIMAIAALVMLVPPLFLQGDWITWLYQGLAVLIVGCPCALILASPVAIVAGIARMARMGILVKGGVHLETLGRIKTIAFDKTGTLTRGEPKVIETIQYAPAFLQVAATVESTSNHPLARAIIRETDRLGITAGQAEETIAVAGQGVITRIDGITYHVGNEPLINDRLINEEIALDITRLKQQGLTIVMAADAEKVLGIFGLADEIRDESEQLLAALRRIGINRSIILSGDHQTTVDKVSLKVQADEAYGRLLPEDKARMISEMSKQGRIAMVGDGINDAPALASATLGIAMGKGSDSALETADIVLMQDHIGRLPSAISLSKRVNRIIRFNIVFALALKLIALLLTIPGLLTLWIAILSDMGATVFVTLVSLTILGARDEA